MSDKNEWFSRGVDSHKERGKNESPNRSRSSGRRVQEDPFQMDRYYISPKDEGENKHVYVVDNDPLVGYVHKFPVDGNWGYRLPCPVDNKGYADECVLCQMADDDIPGKAGYSRMVSNYTVIDIDGYTTDDDDYRHMTINILEAEDHIIEVFDPKERQYGSLVGTVWQVTRQQRNTGDTWVDLEQKPLDDFVEDNRKNLYRTLSSLPEEWGFYEGDGEDREFTLKPLPYEEIIVDALMTYDEQREYLKSLGKDIFTSADDVDTGGSSGNGDSEFGGDSVPGY